MAASGKVLGTVTSVVGEAKATAADGTVRVLQVGDVVHSDEVITTSAAGAINIALESGRTLDCGANTDLSLHESILGVGTAIAASPAAPGSVEALQQAIAAGQDPSQIAPATAAGGAPGAGGPGDGGGGTPVVLEQANTSSVVSAGFPTAGDTITFPLPEFELLPDGEEEQPPAVSVSVQVQVQVQVQVEVQVDVSVQGQPNLVSGPAEGGVFAVSASGDAVNLIEGTMEGTMMIPFVITLDRVFDTDVQVTYQVVPGSASTPSDFFDGVLTATITIPAGQTSFTVPIQIVRDHVVEANESFHISLIDAINATINPDSDSASVTIFNDDAPPVANNDTNWAQEDTHVTAAGNVLQDQPHAGAPSGSFADAVDTDFEPLSVTNPGTYAGTYGTLVLNSNGSYTYTLNNGNAAVQALDSGETLTDSFAYSATDGFNTPDSATLTLTIFGSNDAPTVAADTNWAREDTNTTASGNVLQDLAHAGAPSGSFADHADSDTDVEVLTASLVSSATGSFGSLVLNSNGSYTYTLNSGNAAVQGLDEGESLTDTFTYAASDGTTSTNATLTITIFGSNDAPTVAADTNWSKEDTNTTASGNVLQTVAHAGAPSGSFSDVVDSDVDVESLTASLVSSATGSFGSLVLNSNGSYTYTLNNGNAAVQGLDDGETLTDTFTYAASDGTTSTNATLTITIFGSNDAPTVAADTNWAKEDTNSTASGNVLQDLAHAGAPSGSFADHADSDTDVEPLTTSLVSSATGSFGSLVLNSNGSYTYTLNNANASVQALDVGETLTDTFTYASSDGTTSTNATLTITIFGTNDAPTVAADTNWSKEDTNTTASGNVLQDINHAGAPLGSFADHADSDVDVEPLTTTLVSSATGSFGSLVLNSNGSYIYTLNNGNAAVQALDDGETLTDTFTYAASDGTTSTNATLTITIFGSNDGPGVQADTNWTKEEGPATATGNVLQDVNHPGAPSGTFADHADTDGDADTLTTSLVSSATGSYGSLVLNSDGSYTYTLNNANAAVQALDNGETLTDTFTYAASDGATSLNSTLTITIFGTNDAPTVAADTNWSKEDTNTTATGNVLQTIAHAGAPSGSFSDVADSDTDVEPLTASLVSSATGTYGSLVLNSDGGYTYTLNSANGAVQALDTGETLTDTFTYAANDGTTSTNGTLTITIFGTNDAPTVAADTNWAKEDTNTTATGNVLQTIAHGGAPSGSFSDVADSDVDVESLTASLVSSATGTYGSLVLNSDGSYTYTLNNANGAVQALDTGETLTDTFTYAANDGTTSINATLTITIFGTNDAPTVAADTNWAKEDTNTTASGNVLQTIAHSGAPSGSFSDMADTDVDVETLTVTTTGTFNGTYGSLQLNSDGTYTYTLNNSLPAVQTLSPGQTLTDNFAYTMTDGTASANSTLTITIFGTDDGVEIRDLTPSLSGGEAIVLEADLSDGSSPDAAALTKAGDFTISAPDGVASLAIGGTAVITNGVFSAASITTGLGNTLNVTSYNAATGVVSYTYTLNDDETHPNANGANSIFDNSAVVLVDEDGDTDNDTLAIQIVDDLPASAAPSGTIGNDDGESLVGLIQYDMNADDRGLVTLSAPVVTSGGDAHVLTSHGETLVYSVADTNGDGLDELYARADLNGNGTVEGSELVFVLAPTTAGTDEGDYTLTMHDVVDLPAPIITTNFSEVTASGPVDKLAVYDDASHTSAHLLVSAVNTVPDDVNPNQGFIGINNNIMNNGETIRYEFGTVNTSNLTISHELINDMTLTVFDTGNKANGFSWQAFRDGDGMVGTGTVTFANNAQPAPIHVDGGFDTVVFSITADDFKVGGVSYTKLGDPQDVNLAMVFGGADADGDAISGAFNITITSGNGTAESQILQQLLSQP